MDNRFEEFLPVHTACYEGNLNQISKLLKENSTLAELKLKSTGDAPLHLAAEVNLIILLENIVSN